MASVFEKLNLKDQREILVVNAPESFEAELASLKSVVIQRDPQKLETVGFALVFATQQAEVDAMTATLISKTKGDALLWFAYPKGTSRNYRCEFNRDNGWDALRKAGFESVRMVAIDEDWSALRFRRIEFMKTHARGAHG